MDRRMMWALAVVLLAACGPTYTPEERAAMAMAFQAAQEARADSLLVAQMTGVPRVRHPWEYIPSIRSGTGGTATAEVEWPATGPGASRRSAEFRVACTGDVAGAYRVVLDWPRSSDDSAQVALDVDSAGWLPQWVQASRSASGGVLLAFALATAEVAALQAGTSLTAQVDGVTVDFTLDGATAALDRLEGCSSDYLAEARRQADLLARAEARMREEAKDPCKNGAVFKRRLGSWYLDDPRGTISIRLAWPDDHNKLRRQILAIGNGDPVRASQVPILCGW